MHAHLLTSWDIVYSSAAAPCSCLGKAHDQLHSYKQADLLIWCCVFDRGNAHVLAAMSPNGLNNTWYGTASTAICKARHICPCPLQVGRSVMEHLLHLDAGSALAALLHQLDDSTCAELLQERNKVRLAQQVARACLHCAHVHVHGHVQRAAATHNQHHASTAAVSAAADWHAWSHSAGGGYHADYSICSTGWAHSAAPLLPAWQEVGGAAGHRGHAALQVPGGPWRHQRTCGGEIRRLAGLAGASDNVLIAIHCASTSAHSAVLHASFNRHHATYDRCNHTAGTPSTC
jgi:hypothetical protein